MLKVELNFTSKMLPSKNPEGIINGREAFYKVRHTTACLLVQEGKTNKKYTATVVCNVNDKDNIALGQKYAVKKLLDTMGGPAKDKDFRSLIWTAFPTHSKNTSKIIN